jgi:hypothetical protein
MMNFLLKQPSKAPCVPGRIPVSTTLISRFLAYYLLILIPLIYIIASLL